MKTVLVEPLTINEDLLRQLSGPLSEDGNEFVSFAEKPQSTEEWLERTKGANQIILANTKMPADVVEQNSALKYINVAFTGTDHVPVRQAQEKGILVSNAAGYSNEAVAELVLGMAISLLRQVKEADLGVREGETSAAFLGEEIAGKTVGIIGMGKIGMRVAEIFHAMQANLIAYNRSESEEAKALGVKYVSLEDLLAQSDIVTLHLPLNEETKGFLGKVEFAQMKESAIFVNCARGPIVDNAALAEALNHGKIRAAGVDVFDMEPPLPEDYPLLQAKNLLLTPHVAYFTKEAMEKRARFVFENAVRFLRGEEIASLVK